MRGWHNSRMSTLPQSIDDTLALLARADYVAERSLATAVFLALKMSRPLFLEGEAGVGKTEIAKVLAGGLGRPLVRLQCYEGLDIASAVYEWNYSRQMIEIRLAETQGTSRDTVAKDIFSERFLIKRPLMQALEGGKGGAPVLLIDELDRTDEPFEAYLLEVLSDFQITIPEIGTVRATEPPIVVLTSNRTREIHDAIKRRCFYHWVDYPDAARELEILKRKAPEASESLSREVVAFVQRLRKMACSSTRTTSLAYAAAMPSACSRRSGRSSRPPRSPRWEKKRVPPRSRRLISTACAANASSSAR